MLFVCHEFAPVFVVSGMRLVMSEISDADLYLCVLIFFGGFGTL